MGFVSAKMPAYIGMKIRKIAVSFLILQIEIAFLSINAYFKLQNFLWTKNALAKEFAMIWLACLVKTGFANAKAMHIGKDQNAVN